MSTTEAPWIRRLKKGGSWNPFWLGLTIAIGFLLIRCGFDALSLVTVGFPEGSYPLWRSDTWWSELINAALIGFVPAALLFARHGIDSDLNQLKPRLPGGDADVNKIRAAATRPFGIIERLVIFSGIVGGIGLVFVDPTMSAGAEPSLTNPNFIWSVMRTPLFTSLVFILIVSDLIATRTYLRMGRNQVEVDLLDIESMSPFARKGLRSALIWVIYSIIFSLFWLGDDVASNQNYMLLAAVLCMATAAFIVPLVGVHTNILSVKRAELDRVRSEMRAERDSVTSKSSDDEFTSSRLANLVAYYQLIDQTREWPIDAANLLRFILYILIGLGSWLGGAIVEQLLDMTIGG